MDRDNTIARLENIAKHAVHTAGEDIFILNLDDGLAIHEAIEALKAQLSQEGTTKDTISRQAAIDLVTDMEFMNFTAKGILRDSLRKLSPAQPELNLENLVRMIEFGITATNSNDAYSLGMRNGMRWCKSLIDGVEPKFEGMEGATT